jgi:GNAT superfamily N-acetyltransferase
VVTEADRQAVYGFRYAVIVEELSVNIASADHQRRVIIDPEDRTGQLFATFLDGEIIATLRVNFLRDSVVEPHESVLRLDKLLEREREVSSVSTRFLVAAPFRGTVVAVRTLAAWYRYCRACGIQRDYILVKPKLTDMYTRIGFRRLGDMTYHPEVGGVQPLALDCADEEHLRSIRSPFVRCFPSRVTTRER